MGVTPAPMTNAEWVAYERNLEREYYAEKVRKRNVAINKSLSFGARGLYALLQSYGIGLEDTVDVAIIRQFSQSETDDELASLIVELQQAGLVKDSVF